MIYVAAERHALVKRRLAAWRKRHGVLNLPLVVLDGLFNLATDPSHAVEILRIADHIAERTGHAVGWIIVDTKAQVMGGGDENASKDVSVLNNNLARLQTIGAHVTVVDHTPQNDPMRMKGNGGLAGAADGSFLVRKEGAQRILTAGSKAPNDGPDDIEIVFTLESVTLWGRLRRGLRRPDRTQLEARSGGAGMTLKIVSADQRAAEAIGVKCLIVGPSGVGKTSLLRSLDAKKTLFLDVEAGDLSLAHDGGGPVRPLQRRPVVGFTPPRLRSAR